MSQENREIVDSNWDRIHKTHYAAPSSNTITSSYVTIIDDPRFKYSASYASGTSRIKMVVGELFETNSGMYAITYTDGPLSCSVAGGMNLLITYPDGISENVFFPPGYGCKKIVFLKEDFGNINSRQTSSNVVEKEFDNYAKQLGKHNFTEACEKMKKINDKLSNFPKHLSYEGSVVLCVMLSMKEVAYPHLSNLPSIDQSLIRSLIPKDIINFDTFEVKFDENKDFTIIFSTPPYDKEFVLSMFNSVAHPRPEDLNNSGVVPIEKDGDKIEVGGKIILNRKGIGRLIGIDNKSKSDTEEEPQQRRQSVAGRNAFEIRSDVMQMALDFATHNKSQLTPEEVVNVAKKFYAFVENKR